MTHLSKLIANMTNINDQLNCTKFGTLKSTKGLVLESQGINPPVGARLKITTNTGSSVIADAVGFNNENSASLLPITSTDGLFAGARIEMLSEKADINVGYAMLGRVINALGQPIDGLGEIKCVDTVPLVRKGIPAMDRGIIDEVLDVGVRAINGLFTVGLGQRIGLMAGTGVGKSVTLSMIAKNTDADIVVIGLIGERGREVKEFVEKTLTTEAKQKSIIVAAPADEPPLVRLQSAQATTAIAEYFRDQGKNVLLIMDSLTRFAQAQREIALSLGEPPASKGYPPSVFAMLPALVERAGKGSVGSITAIYTVLAEGDDTSGDPILDSARGVLDGHIVLSRDIASRGIYPAIDVAVSISRVMSEIVSEQHLRDAANFKRFYVDYNNNRDLISIGAYQPGSDSKVDAAIEKHELIEKFICQSPNESASMAESVEELYEIINSDG